MTWQKFARCANVPTSELKPFSAVKLCLPKTPVTFAFHLTPKLQKLFLTVLYLCMWKSLLPLCFLPKEHTDFKSAIKSSVCNLSKVLPAHSSHIIDTVQYFLFWFSLMLIFHISLTKIWSCSFSKLAQTRQLRLLLSLFWMKILYSVAVDIPQVLVITVYAISFLK